SAERGLLKDQREKFAAQSGVVAGGLRLDVRGELQEFARLRGAPFRSGEQIVDEQNRCSERCCWHFFLYFAAERARCGECSDFFGADDEAAFEVDARTSSNVLRNSRTCARETMNGGRRRRVKSWVQLISKPWFRASVTNGAPSTDSSTPMIRPSPRISRMKSNFSASAAKPSRSSAPRARTLSSSFEFSTIFRNSRAVAQTSGPPPKVDPCKPGEMCSATALEARIAPRGKPAARGFAITTMSGFERNF